VDKSSVSFDKMGNKDLFGCYELKTLADFPGFCEKNYTRNVEAEFVDSLILDHTHMDFLS